MSTLSNHRSSDRIARTLVTVAVTALAGLAIFCSLGHRSVRAEAQPGPASGLVSQLVHDPLPIAAATDPSLPSASSALEHAAGAQAEIATTF